MSYKNYNKFKKINKFIRNKFSSDPFKSFNDKGINGKILNKLGNKIIDKPVRKIAYFTTGIFYNPKKHNPIIGSILYTLLFFAILGLLGLLVNLF